MVLLILLQEVSNSLPSRQVNHIVLVATFISGDILVWSIAPITVHTELVHTFLGVDELDEVVCRWRLSHAKALLGDAEGFEIVSGLNLLHALTLPVIEEPHDFDHFTSE